MGGGGRKGRNGGEGKMGKGEKGGKRRDREMGRRKGWRKRKGNVEVGRK